MLIETVELALPHVGLGRLAEAPLLELFASAQAHRLTRDTGGTLRDVVDADGTRLYPGYFWLQLRVPRGAPLERFGLWDRVEIGVDVKRYGRLMLDSTYALAAPGQLGTAWDLDALPSMRAASMWMVDGRAAAAQPASPRDGTIAELPDAGACPPAVEALRRMRAGGGFTPRPALRGRAPFAYDVQLGRDVAPGQNLMFATYVRIMDAAEQDLLGKERWPALPLELLAHLRLVEREVFFLEHTGAGRRVLVDVRATLSPCPQDAHGADRDLVSAGALDATYELYEAGSNALLVCGRARKLFVVPRGRVSLVGDLARFFEPAAEPV